MSDFIIHTTEGDMTPDEFLEKLSASVWPANADRAEFELEGEDRGCLSVTYVLEPFGLAKTIDYGLSVSSNELRVSFIGAVPLDGAVDFKELAGIVGSYVYEDFKSEISW